MRKTSYKKEYCFLNGRILPVEKAKILITDAGVLRGYAIFDSIAAQGDRIIFFDEHYARFLKSANIMRLKAVFPKTRVRKIIEALLRKNGYPSSRIRIVLTGGALIGSLRYDTRSANFFILVQNAETPHKESYLKGVKLIAAECKRELPNAKTNNYITAIHLQPLRMRAGAAEILYYFNNNVLEATTSNFFIVKGNTLITPKENILEGIVRGKIIQCAKKFMKVEERNVKMKELKTADEAFITSTYKKVMPVVKIDNYTIGNGKIGPNTKILMERYAELERHGR